MPDIDTIIEAHRYDDLRASLPYLAEDARADPSDHGTLQALLHAYTAGLARFRSAMEDYNRVVANRAVPPSKKRKLCTFMGGFYAPIKEAYHTLKLAHLDIEVPEAPRTPVPGNFNGVPMPSTSEGPTPAEALALGAAGPLPPTTVFDFPESGNALLTAENLPQPPASVSSPPHNLQLHVPPILSDQIHTQTRTSSLSSLSSTASETTRLRREEWIRQRAGDRQL